MTPAPLYRYELPFEANSEGPTSAPEPVPADVVAAGHGRRLLGRAVGYPIGIPASPLTANSTWVRACSDLGFNVITYKTVRLRETRALPAPNWLFVDGLEAPLPVGEPLSQVAVDGTKLAQPASRTYSMVNSFGIPSPAPEEWQSDVRLATGALRDGQLLIVSVVGDYEELSGDALVSDFVDVALAAEHAGATIIELNLSCPNTVKASGPVQPPICESPDDSARIVKSVRAALDANTKLVVKLAYLARPALERLIAAVADSVDGVAGINTLQVPVVGADGAPVFIGTRDSRTKFRDKAGLSGIAIRDYALDFVRSLALIRRVNRWEFDIIAMGGVMEPHDVRALMAVGADAVQSATAAANNPGLPRLLWSDGHQIPSDDERLIGLLGTALADPQWSFRSVAGLAKELRVPAERVSRALASHPDLARVSVLRDVDGNTLYAARDSSPTVRERLEQLRWILAR
jgi:dihydroorotate dehydrogenase